MNKQIDFTQACQDLTRICQEVIATRQPIEISSKDRESVSLIPTSELNSLLETVYLFSSHENAQRLLDALQRAKARTNLPRTLEEIRQEFGLEEEKASA